VIYYSGRDYRIKFIPGITGECYDYNGDYSQFHDRGATTGKPSGFDGGTARCWACATDFSPCEERAVSFRAMNNQNLSFGGSSDSAKGFHIVGKQGRARN